MPDTICVAAILKHEDRFVEEWVAYHRLLGVDHFYLYDNDPRQPLSGILAQHRDYVTVRPWLIGHDDRRYPGRTMQIKAYAHCLENYAGRYAWVAFIDCDEFIALEEHRDLKEFLAEFDSHDSIALNWHVFGHNGYYDDPPGLVIECLTRRMKEPRRMTKSLSRPEAIASIENAHLCGLKAGRTRVDANKQPYTEALYPEKTRVARINHYQCRSFTNWMHKPERGEAGVLAGDPTSAWRFSEEGCLRQFVRQIALNKNEHVDTSMLRHVEPVKLYLRQLPSASEFARKSQVVDLASASRTESETHLGTEIRDLDCSLRVRIIRSLRPALLSIRLLMHDIRHCPRFFGFLLEGELSQATAMISHRRRRNAIAYARAASDANDWPEAAWRWRNVVNGFGDEVSAAAYAALCKALHCCGDLDAAEAAAQQGRNKHPANIRVTISWARIALARKSWSDAVLRWQLVLDQLNGDGPAKVYLQLSVAHRQQGNIVEAEELLRRGLASHPEETRLLRQYAKAATARKNWPDAVKRWQSLLNKLDGNAPTHVYWQISRGLDRQGKTEEAEEFLRQGLAKHPADICLATRYAELATAQKHWPEAITRWEAIRDMMGGSTPEVYLQIGRAHREHGNIDEAEKVVRQGLAKRPRDVKLLTEQMEIGELRQDFRQVVEASDAEFEIIEAAPTRITDNRDLATVCNGIMRSHSHDQLLVAGRNLRWREGDTRLLRSIEGLAYLRLSQMELARAHWARFWLKAIEDRAFAGQRSLELPRATTSQRFFEAVSRTDQSIPRPVCYHFCVYTALFGEYDELRSPTYMPAGLKFICFSDRARDVAGWEVRIVELDLERPAMKSRLLKLLPYDYLRDYEYSLYVDANTLFLADPLVVYDRWLRDKPFVAWSHPDRSGVYEEIEAIIISLRHSPGPLLDQHQYFRECAVPEQTGLIEASFLWRDHRDVAVRKLMEEWWEFLVRFGSHRDQPALGYLMWKTGIRPAVLPDYLGTSRDNEFFRKFPHNRTVLEFERAKVERRTENRGMDFADVQKMRWRGVSVVAASPRRLTWVCRDKFRNVASSVMRGHQLSEMARLRLTDAEVNYVDETNLGAQSHSVLILTKGFLKDANLDELASLKERGNIVCADYVDDPARDELHECIDAYIAASMTQFIQYSERYIDKLVHLITHHSDRRLNGIRGPEDFCNIGYFGELANALYSSELQGIIDFCVTNTQSSEATWLPKLRHYNVHYAVRNRRAINGFKPFLKGFTAAQCHSNIIVCKDESDARYYLGSDYPYILKDEKLNSVLEMIDYAKASFGGADWHRGLAMMKSVRQRCDPAVIESEIRALLIRCR